MPKLVKQMYYNRDGVEKINCYHIYIPRELAEQTGLEKEDNVSIKAEGNKIIIEKDSKK